MSRHSVVIPVVQKNTDTGGEVLEIHCEPRSKQDKDEAANGMDSIIEKLREINLHNAGKTAVGAIERLLSSEAKESLNIAARRITYNYNTSKGVIDEGRSAELGIALALLMNAGNCKNSMVIASGSINVKVGDNCRDADIEAVNDLENKFSIVLKNSAVENSVFFIPQANIDNKPGLLESANYLWEQRHIKIVPVATLSEAINYLKISVVPDKNPYLYWLGLGIVLTGFILWFLNFLLETQQPVVAGKPPPAHLSIDFDKEYSPLVEIPFLVCNPNDPFPITQNLKYVGLTRTISIKDLIGWHIKFNTNTKTLATNSSVNLIVAFVGKKSGLDFLPINDKLERQITLPIANSWSWMHQQGDIAESGILVFMAKQQEPFDLQKLQKQFDEHYPGEPYDLSKVLLFLMEQAETNLPVAFDSLEQPSACESNHVK